MTEADRESRNQRVLLLPPTARDAQITERLLQGAGIEAFVCKNVAQFCEEAAKGAGALLIAEEHLLGDPQQLVAQMLKAQPAWSDLPLLILTLSSQHNSAILYEWQQSANVTLIARPIRIESFLSLVRSQLHDRSRQYTVLRLLHSVEQREREFRQLADAMPQMVFTADANGQIEYLNQRAIAYFGIERENITRFKWSLVIHADDLPSARTRWFKAVKTGTAFQSEFRVREVRTEGFRWHLARAVPVLGENEQVVRWFGTGTDIHIQKMTEQKLNTALAKAAAGSRAKSEFLANMSHEIRTPMTAVLGYAELLAEKESDAEKLEFLSVIKQNGTFLLEIINDILDLSKIEAGKLQTTPEFVKLAPFVYSVESLMGVRAAEDNLKFEVEFDGATPRVIRSDPKRLRQILVNLVGNAIKFTEMGSVRLVVRYEDRSVLFEVIDTGIGMSAPQVQQLFQPFQQADASVSRQFGGSGLGLAISQRLARMLGGEITVVSEAGRGSTFTLSIDVGAIEAADLVDANQSDYEPLPEQSERPNLSCNVLVVDDRRDVRVLAGRILANAGARVEYAVNGLEAVKRVSNALAAGAEPDIVLMDMQMPVMDGYEATENLRRIGFHRPIIALTADAMQGDMERCVSSGCNAYVSKPIVSLELLGLLAHYLEHSGSHRNP